MPTTKNNHAISNDSDAATMHVASGQLAIAQTTSDQQLELLRQKNLIHTQEPPFLLVASRNGN